MPGVTTLTHEQLALLLGSGALIGLLCAAKDLRWPRELPAMVLGVPLHAALNIALLVEWPASFAGITEAMVLRGAYLLVLSIFVVGGASVAAALGWAMLRNPS